ncbi:unnamed protein product [Pylaiella littoralis]
MHTPTDFLLRLRVTTAVATLSHCTHSRLSPSPLAARGDCERLAMSRAITQPVNQVRLTNVAVVRLNKTGKRFEIACYRNKVVNWRNRVETDLDEVLQIESVFENVSKGVLAKNKDLLKAFGTDSQLEVCRIILDKGEMQVSDKERQVALESVFRDVATIVSEKCVNPASNRPYTVSMIEKAMRDIHFSAHPTRSAKQQALEVMKKLKEVMPIDRAKMKLRITTDDNAAPLKEALRELGVVSFESGESAGAGSGGGEVVDFLVDPGMYRDVEEAVRTVAGGRGALEVLQLSVQQEGEADMDVELLRKGLLAVKLKGEEEEGRRNKKGRGGKGGAAGCASVDAEEEAGLAMPAAGRRGKGRGGGFSDDDNDQGRRQGGGGGGGGARGEGKGAGEGGVGKRGGKKGKGARRREKEEAAERDVRQEEARQRQEKREQAKAERVEAAEEGGEGAVTAVAQRDTREEASGGGKAKKSLGCNTCGLTFPDTGAHREHYKSDLHRYNLKLKMKGGAPVSEEEFRLVDANDFFHSDMMGT